MKKRLLILALILLSFNCSVFAKPVKVVYLIPADFTGGVLVLYDQPDGAAPEIAKDGTISYRIPKDGFLKVNAAEPENVDDYGFSYVDDQNNPTPIEYILPQGTYILKDSPLNSIDTLTEEQKNTKIYAMNHRTIGFKIKGQSMTLYAFSIGYPKDSRSIYIKTLDKTEEVEHQLNKRP